MDPKRNGALLKPGIFYDIALNLNKSDQLGGERPMGREEFGNQKRVLSIKSIWSKDGEGHLYPSYPKPHLPGGKFKGDHNNYNNAVGVRGDRSGQGYMMSVSQTNNNLSGSASQDPGFGIEEGGPGIKPLGAYENWSTDALTGFERFRPNSKTLERQMGFRGQDDRQSQGKYGRELFPEMAGSYGNNYSNGGQGDRQAYQYQQQQKEQDLQTSYGNYNRLAGLGSKSNLFEEQEREIGCCSKISRLNPAAKSFIPMKEQSNLGVAMGVHTNYGGRPEFEMERAMSEWIVGNEEYMNKARPGSTVADLENFVEKFGYKDAQPRKFAQYRNRRGKYRIQFDQSPGQH